mgnify:CR=1 FL=1
MNDYQTKNDQYIWKNFKYFGGVIFVGYKKDEAFIPDKKTGNFALGYVARANDDGKLRSSSKIVLNPVLFEKDSKYTFREVMGVIIHEIGEDMGLYHPDGIYPKTGIRALRGEPPNRDDKMN